MQSERPSWSLYTFQRLSTLQKTISVLETWYIPLGKLKWSLVHVLATTTIQLHFFPEHQSLTLKKFEVLPCHLIFTEESYDDIANQMHTIHI